jgi:acetylornithine/succinyldiaminopimelate/putrescine aminotransferase
VNEKVAATIKAGDHATTFGGGPVVSSVACAVFETIMRPEFLLDVQRKGQLLGASLRSLARSPARPLADARGVGLMWGIEFEQPVAPFVAAAFEKGLLVTSAGDNVIRLLPPLVISDAEIAEAVSILAEVIQ